jgi:hypothetical protein
MVVSTGRRDVTLAPTERIGHRAEPETALDPGGGGADIRVMGQRAGLKRREDEAWGVCPSCGREAAGLVTGQCNHCLQPLPWGGSRVETGRILELSEFHRARGKAKRSGDRRGARVVGATVVGLVVGAVLVGLFMAVMVWIEGFLGRGMVWRE